MIFHQFTKFSIKKINISIIMDETNFNADDYTVEELEKIFDLEKPYSKTDLDAVANDFIETYMKKNHRDYVLFFQKAKFILEAEITKEEMNYKTPTSNTFVSRNEMEKYKETGEMSKELANFFSPSIKMDKFLINAISTNERNKMKDTQKKLVEFAR